MIFFARRGYDQERGSKRNIFSRRRRDLAKQLPPSWLPPARETHLPIFENDERQTATCKILWPHEIFAATCQQLVCRAASCPARLYVVLHLSMIRKPRQFIAEASYLKDCSCLRKRCWKGFGGKLTCKTAGFSRDTKFSRKKTTSRSLSR